MYVSQPMPAHRPSTGRIIPDDLIKVKLVHKIKKDFVLSTRKDQIEQRLAEMALDGYFPEKEEVEEPEYPEATLTEVSPLIAQPVVARFDTKYTNKFSTPIVCINDSQLFGGIALAARFYNLEPVNVRKVLSGNAKAGKGLLFRPATPKEIETGLVQQAESGIDAY